MIIKMIVDYKNWKAGEYVQVTDAVAKQLLSIGVAESDELED